MMVHRSWYLLEEESPEWRLPDDLRARDALGAVDCGWVEQMFPFLESFSREGDLVLDPFAGFGSTLVACGLRGRRGIGIEIEPDRLELIEARLQRAGLEQDQRVVLGDARNTGLAAGSVDLVLTNLPYFFGTTPSEKEGQFYRIQTYEDYLCQMEETFCHLSTILRPDGYLVAMIENIRTAGGVFLPQAFDVAARLGKHLTLEEERVLCYPKPVDGRGDPGRTNRAHEYALIARNRRLSYDITDAVSILRDLRAEVSFMVIGSLAVHLLASDLLHRPPADVDLWLGDDRDSLERFTTFFQSRGFQVFSWDLPIRALPETSFLMGRGYLRAVRTGHSGSGLVVDATYGREVLTFEEALPKAVETAGLLSAAPETLGQWLRARGRPDDLALAERLSARFS